MKTFSMIWAPVALCALALAVSCQKKEIEEPTPEPAESQVQLRTFTCVIAGDTESKVAIDADGKTTWEAGDEILVHGYRYPQNKTVTLTAADISADGKTATITVDVSDMDPVSGENPPYYAAYPAGAYISPEENYNNYYSAFGNTNLPLMAAYAEGDTFVFSNLCAVMSFSIDGDFDSYIFTGNDSEVVGYDNYVVKLTGATMDFKSWKTANPKTSISGSVSSGVNYICLPYKVEFSKGFKILFVKDDEIVKYVANKNEYTIRHGDFLPLGDLTSYLKTYVPSHESAIPTENAIDLSADGTANSYIVYASSDPEAVYKFKSVKGNSAESVGKVNSVEILWETWNNTETVTENSVIAAADYEGDYIYFQMPETSIHAGNAVIAAKNATGTILWSWHIWVPSTTITLVSEANYSAKQTMDRNLGALVSAAADAPAPVGSFGLLYEWGRKDPFPGLGVASGSTSATVAGGAITYQGTRMTVEEAIQNPTVYAYATAWTPAETATTADGVLWGETTKTVYDPCPVGYMLPQRAGTDFWKGTQMKDYSGFTYSADNALFTMGSLVFPFAGYIDNSGELHKKAGLRSILWSGRWDSGTENGYGFYAYLDSDGPYFKRTSIARSRGGSVRCVAEASE